MSRMGKTSKFRHVQPTPAKPDLQWSNIKAASTIWDCANLVAANDLFWAMTWMATGGGKLCVFNHDKPGKQDHPPMIIGHSAPIIDWTFHPFNQHLVCTGSEDSTIKVWQIPEGGLTEDVTEPVVTHTGHGKKVGILSWHPSAEHVLASASMDHTIKLWDVEKGERGMISCHTDNILSVNWNLDGSLLNTTSKDKKVRVIDPRTGSVAAECSAHEGSKTCRSVWAKRRNQIVTVGFSKKQERQLMIFEPTKLAGPLHVEDIDSATGVMMPFFDEDTNMLYVGGKGDGNVRYYELGCGGPIMELEAFSSTSPAKGLCFLPKTALNVKDCEIARMLKLEANVCTPVSFILPRKSAASEFQSDVYPPTFSHEPAISANDFFGGQNAEPKTLDMQPYWEGANSPQSRAEAGSPTFHGTSEKLITEKDVEMAEAKVKQCEEALDKARKELEEIKEKKAAQ
eukprot:TRINITY_DN1464_c0_g1_i1.p1 TRINITY_DN1464_c0_g1~~TRINITY_DN1464_c0_g1_i1.p1  ORF type:complete len:483 (+),score=132.60 TRINITY_DN1464_c0_g1_i1:87-1451(+)